MCLFTHLAAGALVGGLLGNVPAAVAAGLASHAVLDALPHYDFPDWRIEIAGAALTLALLGLLGLGTAAAVAGGLAGVLPDLEILLWRLGRLPRSRFLFPSHSGLIRHGRATGPATLGWQAALAAGCFLTLMLVGPSAPSARAAQPAAGRQAAVRMGPPAVELLGSGPAQTRLRFRFPVLAAPPDWRAATPARIAWHQEPRRPEGADPRDPGLPPQAAALLAVPRTGAPAWRLESVRWWREPDRAVAPDSLVRVGLPRVLRDVPLLQVAVPVWTPGRGVPAEVVVVVDHAAAGRFADFLAAARRAPGAGGGAAGNPDAGPAPAGLLNRDLWRELAGGARAWRATAAAKRLPAAPADPFELTRHWARLEVTGTGVQAVDGYDLVLAGVPLAAVDLASLRLYKGGGRELDRDPAVPDSLQRDRNGLREVAILVEDQDGEWDEGDRILFYGVDGDTWLDRLEPDAPRLEHFEHLYDPRGIYWLTWEAPGTGSPLPGTARRIQTLAAPAGGGLLMSTQQTRLHLESSGVKASEYVRDGWAWDTRITGEKLVPFEIPALVSGRQSLLVVDIRAVPRGRNQSTHVNQAAAWLNDAGSALRATWSIGQQEDSLRVRLAGWIPDLRQGDNLLRLRNENLVYGTVQAYLALESIDLLYWSPLVKGEGPLPFAFWKEQVTSPGQSIDLQVSVPGAGVGVWDVGDPFAPVRLEGTYDAGPAATLTLGIAADASQSRHFVAFDPAAAADLGRPTLRVVQPRPLREDWRPVDYVVIHESRFGDAAAQLAGLRGARLPGIASPAADAVDEQDIYDSFSGGLKDPYALRNYLRWLWTTIRAGEPAGGHDLRYVCFLGDASRDNRNNLRRQPDGSIYDYLPTALRTTWPLLPYGAPYQTWWGRMAYATDDELVCFDTHPRYPWNLDLPDLACGRLPARTVTEANQMVQRLTAVGEAPLAGPWRNRIVLSADDFSQPSDDRVQIEHTRQAEAIARLAVPTTLDLEKLYLIDYEKPAAGIGKPAAQRRAVQLLDDGVTLFYYVGHGGDDVLADEQMLRSEDIPGLSNGLRRGLFAAFSCDVGVFDDPYRQSMSEAFVSQEAGGMVLSVAASQATLSGPNDDFSLAFFEELYPERRVVADRPVGLALQLAKADPTLAIAADNNQKYNLMGDPALRLPQPVTAAVDLAGSPDTLLAGLRQVVRATLGGEAAGATGYDLRVQESHHAESEPYLAWEYDWETQQPVQVTRYYDYTLPGANIFRGEGPVAGSELALPFKVPLQVNTGDEGRYRLVVSGPWGAWAAAVVVPVRTTEIGQGDDTRGPDISLFFDDDRYRVRAGDALRAAVADSSGISVLGTRPATSLLLEFDRSGVPADVTEAFSFAPGSFTSGELEFPLPADLRAGSHLVSLTASDALGNVGSDTLSFLVVPEGVVGIEGTTIFPNPTPGPCRLVCELSDPMSIEWSIHTVAGRRVRLLRRTFATPGPKVIEWDGRDHRGDEIANGVYLYVLRGRPAVAEAREIVQTGQIVIMR